MNSFSFVFDCTTKASALLKLFPAGKRERQKGTHIPFNLYGLLDIAILAPVIWQPIFLP